MESQAQFPSGAQDGKPRSHRLIRRPFVLDEESGRSVNRQSRETLQEVIKRNQDEVSYHISKCEQLGEEIANLKRASLAVKEETKAQVSSKQLDDKLKKLQVELEACQAFEKHWKERAEFWQELKNEPEALKMLLFEQGWHEKVIQRLADAGHFDEEIVERLGEMAQILLIHLTNLTKGGSKQAARQLATLAIYATEKTNALAEQHLESFRPVAQTRLDWPLMTTRKNNFPQPYGRPFLEEIQLGECSGFNNFHRSKWKITDDTGRLAWRLWLYVSEKRQVLRFIQSHPRGNVRIELSDLELRTAQLEDYSEKTYAEWWAVAKEFLNESLEECERCKREALKKKIGGYKRPGRRKVAGKTERPDELERLFYEALRAKFKSFSGANRRSF